MPNGSRRSVPVGRSEPAGPPQDRRTLVVGSSYVSGRLSPMTAGLIATSTYAASAVPFPDAGSVIHAVARPVVDGLDQSVCGVLVSVRAAEHWVPEPGSGRCEECARITA
jgi:hypothetical protein